MIGTSRRALLLVEDFREKQAPSTGERNSVQLVLQGESDDILGRAAVLGIGAEPEREAVPDALGGADRQQLQDAERDGRDVDEAFVGLELARDLTAVVLARPVQVLVAASAPALGHDLEPEVVAEAADDLDEHLEGDLDLEAEAVGIEDAFGAEHGVGGDEDAVGALGIDAEHEADEEAVPEEIAAEVADVLEVAVELDARRAEEVGSIEELRELDAGAADAGAPAPARPAGRRQFIGDGGGADPADEVQVGGQQG